MELLKQSGKFYSISDDENEDKSSRRRQVSSTQVASIHLPMEFFQDITTPNIGLVFSVYNDNTFFPLRQTAASDTQPTRRQSVASSVLVSTVGVEMEFKELDSPIEYTLSLSVDDGESVSHASLKW